MKGNVILAAMMKDRASKLHALLKQIPVCVALSLAAACTAPPLMEPPAKPAAPPPIDAAPN